MEIDRKSSINVIEDVTQVDRKSLINETQVIDRKSSINETETNQTKFHNSSIMFGSLITLAICLVLGIFTLTSVKVGRKLRARRTHRNRLEERHNVLWRRSSIMSPDSDDASTVISNVSTFTSSLPSLNMYSYVDENEVYDYLNPIPLVINDPTALNHYQNSPPENTTPISLTTFF